MYQILRGYTFLLMDVCRSVQKPKIVFQFVLISTWVQGASWVEFLCYCTWKNTVWWYKSTIKQLTAAESLTWPYNNQILTAKEILNFVLKAFQILISSTFLRKKWKFWGESMKLRIQMCMIICQGQDQTTNLSFWIKIQLVPREIVVMMYLNIFAILVFSIYLSKILS